MDRRTFLKACTAGAVAASMKPDNSRADVPIHLWSGYDFGPGPSVPDRLNQGPFDVVDTDWATIGSGTPTDKHIRNYGLGLVGYTWEEGGPSLAARRGEESLEKHVEKLASLPFVDTLYIRCDWRDVQSGPGRLDLHPIWKLTLDAAKTYGLKVGFRVQLSNTVGQPERVALPDFLHNRIPLVNIGKRGRGKGYLEIKYDHPEFIKAFRELNELLAAEFDGNRLIEFMDLMMYGMWGEGHTEGLPNPVGDFTECERIFTEVTKLQIDAWRKVALAVNTQPDSGRAGNREVIDMVVRSGGWLRSDTIVNDEPIQIERLSNRPPWCAVVMEEGWRRDYNVDRIPMDETGINAKEKSMLKVLDLKANYWSLWTEGNNLAKYNELYPKGFATLHQRMGYRIRPGWVWQRERLGHPELLFGFANDGVAGIPGVLRLTLGSLNGSFKQSGCLDAGRPYGGEVRQASFLLPDSMYGASMKLSAEIIAKGGVRHAVEWACAEKLNPDNSFPIQLKEKGKLVWGAFH